MKINKLITNFLILSILVFAVTSCESDDSITMPKGVYDNGILVSGEAGSIYYVSNDSLKVKSEKSSYVIKKDLGQYLQSMAFDTKNAYIMVDNQNTVTVVDRYTFEYIGTITEGLKKPRYMTVVGNKGYVTNWGEGSYGADVDDDYIAVVDLNTLIVISTIPVSIGVERIIEKNGKLYVSHKGGNSTNNVITVIDIATEAKTEITVNDTPDELFFDNSGNLVVLCEGITLSYNDDWSAKEKTPVSITKINTTTNSVASKIIFGANQYTTLLAYDGSDIYYNLGSKIYKMDDSATVLPTSEFVNTAFGIIYGLEVNNENLYVLNYEFTVQSTMSIFNLGTKLEIASVKAPIGASKIYFN